MGEADDRAVALAWAVAVLLVATAVLSVLSAMLERSGPVRLRHWAEEAGGRLLALFEASLRFEVFRYFLSLAAKLSPVALVGALALLLDRLGAPLRELWALAGVGGELAAVELLNRFLVVRDPEPVLRFLTPAYRALWVLLSPLVALLAPLVPARAASRREDEGEEEDDVSDEEIEAFIALGAREGILEPGEEDLLWGIVDFGDTQVRSVMTPRIDMICAPVGETLSELAERFLDSGHSRIPLYQDSIDRIVGVLHIRDVLRGLRAPDPPPASELAKTPFFIPESKPLDELLKEMQESHQQLAIVVDEYGGTAGLVTIEDLLEEIVGEIVDEHEVEPVAAEDLGDGTWRLDGGVHVETLEELFGVEVEETPYETVAGLIFSVLGYVPRPGEAIEWRGLRLSVESVADRRIRSVLVARASADGQAGTARA